MNRSKIEWCDHTWNPITGCLHNCAYCYARTMSKRFCGNVRLNKMAKGDYEVVPARDNSCDLYILEKPMFNETGKNMIYPFEFEPTLHRYRFDYLSKLKNGHNIFVGAMSDVFGEWVPDEWIDEVISACAGKPHHNYLFLTKNPKRYTECDLPKAGNMWYGTTVTTVSDMERVAYLPAGCKTFLSVEPLLEDIEPERCDSLARDVDWIIIGAETGNRKGKVQPIWDWIKRIVLVADTAGIPVFMKDSLIPIVSEKNMRREFPPELMRKPLSKKMQTMLYDTCCECKQHMKKSEMIALQARSQRGENGKQFAYMCKKCFRDFCEKHGLEVPELKNMED